MTKLNIPQFNISTKISGKSTKSTNNRSHQTDNKTKITKSIFIESVCRVNTLSLTGLIVYHFGLSDIFIVQHLKLFSKYKRTCYIEEFRM